MSNKWYNLCMMAYLPADSQARPWIRAGAGALELWVAYLLQTIAHGATWRRSDDMRTLFTVWGINPFKWFVSERSFML